MQGPPEGLGGAGVSAHGPNGMMFTIGIMSFTVAHSWVDEKTVTLVITFNGWGRGQAVQMIMLRVSMV
jgi:hypothetical protein